MTNEQKCPVCGKGMAIDGLHCLCTSMYCKAEGVHLPQDYVIAVNETIDKEKAAAVQEERERIVDVWVVTDVPNHRNIGVYSTKEKAELAIKEMVDSNSYADASDYMIELASIE